MDIKLTQFNYDTNEKEIVGETTTYQIAKSLNDEQMAKVLDDYLNTFGRGYRGGERIGHYLQNSHHTLQGEAIRWALGIIIGLSAQEEKFLDARNETPVLMGKQLTKMIDDGELNMGYMI